VSHCAGDGGIDIDVDGLIGCNLGLAESEYQLVLVKTSATRIVSGKSKWRPPAHRSLATGALVVMTVISGYLRFDLSHQLPEDGGGQT